MRLNAYLARAGVASRRKADEIIKAGKVTINGKPAKLNSDVTDNDDVEIDGRKISSQRLRYILLHKPAGTLTTLKDPHGRRKVADLLRIPERVVPVGRLDYDTTGALLLTNDGELAHKLMHPSFEVDKVYEAEVEGNVTKQMLDKLSNGVRLEDGMTSPAKVRLLPGRPKQTIELTIHEGRRHQVKRMLSAVGLTVLSLHRSRYGFLSLQDLGAARWRDLSTEEINRLKNGTIAG
ncbi:rRNA pseudouridine synthase [Candidatus Saccharibacteria bacterium]|nr:rRNA pseudouridine synthase [Candidatus Saccharibacteria bacterium]